jgi:hypothetical protein
VKGGRKWRKRVGGEMKEAKKVRTVPPQGRIYVPIVKAVVMKLASKG